ncbi:MAG: 1-acyl-sn-glycerol-3-phosphate acyltransferase [Acidobacteria bacterium]|nr:1-acyl-sn-glycerol-3-phosphate acyltransferase [Acidobacteriota bacterium]
MEDWTYEPAQDLNHDFATRLKGFPREPHMWVYALRSAAAMLIRGWLRTYHRFRITRLGKLPESSFVMVANHQSHLDAPCLLAAMPLRRLHRTFPAAAEDYFFSNLPRGIFTSIVINGLPFNREAKGAQSLAVCRELLSTPGNVLILFPEGTRSPDGTLGRFRSGIGRLIEGTDVPVVPCRLIGAHDAYPKGAWIPRPKPVHLIIGEPLRFGHLPKGRTTVQTIGDTLHRAVSDLKPESNVDPPI